MPAVLSIGARGQRIPDWQLDATRKKLTQAPLEVVSSGNMEKVLAVLLDQLDIHD